MGQIAKTVPSSIIFIGAHALLYDILNRFVLHFRVLGVLGIQCILRVSAPTRRLSHICHDYIDRSRLWCVCELALNLSPIIMIERIYIARHGMRLSWLSDDWQRNITGTGLINDDPLSKDGEVRIDTLRPVAAQPRAE